MTENLKMVLLGASSTGKTSIVHRLLHNTFYDATESTIGASFIILNYEGIKYQVWDTAGQERYHSLIPMYYRDSDLILLVYDINDTTSICKVEYYLEKIIPSLNKNYQILVLGNKLDIANQETVTYTDELIKMHVAKYPKVENKIRYINVSAKTGENFDKLNYILQEFGYNIIQQRNDIPNIDIANMIQLGSNTSKNNHVICPC